MFVVRMQVKRLAVREPFTLSDKRGTTAMKDADDFRGIRLTAAR
jgi:hypothetical protein